MSAPWAMPEDVCRRLEELLARTCFLHRPDDFLDTDDGRLLFRQQLLERSEQARNNWAPWVDRAGGLAGRRVTEIGSGTGSGAPGIAARRSATTSSTWRWAKASANRSSRTILQRK